MAENEKMEQAAKTSSDKADKSKKDKSKNAKPSFFARIGRWLREMRSELKKVAWPTGKQTMNNTFIVIAFCAVVCLCIFLFDTIALKLLDALMSLTH